MATNLTFADLVFVRVSDVILGHMKKFGENIYNNRISTIKTNEETFGVMKVFALMDSFCAVHSWQQRYV